METSKRNFLFSITILFNNILLFNNIIVNKYSNYYEFKNPNNEEILKINNIEYVSFNGQIEIIEGDNFEFYCYSSKDIKEDNDGNFIDYINFYNNVQPGSKIDIKSTSSYIIIKGKGYISFGSNQIKLLNINNVQRFELPYDLNNKYYQLDGKGNTLEFIVDNGNICIYLNDICYNSNKIINNLSGKLLVNLRNINNAKGAIIKILYTYRKEAYSIGQGNGDKIQCLIRQQYKFIVKDTLASQYYNLKEGIIKITGNPHVEFNKAIYSSEDDVFYYFTPESNVIEVYLTNVDEGEISAVGINPTIEMNFPKSIKTKISQSIGPQYLRIEIDFIYQYLNEEYIFEFGNTVEILEGTMFKNGHLNKGFYSSNMTLNKNNAKTYTVIYKTPGTFSFKKIYNWIILKEYEMLYVRIESPNEMTFKYVQNNTKNTFFHTEYGRKSNNYLAFHRNIETTRDIYIDYIKIHIYTREEDIRFNVTTREYSNQYKVYNSWKDLEIDKTTIYLIIQTHG